MNPWRFMLKKRSLFLREIMFCPIKLVKFLTRPNLEESSALKIKVQTSIKKVMVKLRTNAELFSGFWCQTGRPFYFSLKKSVLFRMMFCVWDSFTCLDILYAVFLEGYTVLIFYLRLCQVRLACWRSRNFRFVLMSLKKNWNRRQYKTTCYFHFILL